MADHDDFDREMHDADWTESYERQAESGDLGARTCDLLEAESDLSEATYAMLARR